MLSRAGDRAQRSRGAAALFLLTSHHEHASMALMRKRRGRPRTSGVDRAEQLRRAKRAQRNRERAAGLVGIELRVPAALAKRLRTAAASPTFPRDMDRLLDELVLDIERWPRLRELAWNRKDRWIPAPEALSLYERNWRFIAGEPLCKDEAALIERLKARYGSGVLNA